MIPVQRGAEPAILSKPLSGGKTETEKAIEHYTVGWDGKKQYPFARYKHDDVKAALETMFAGKCAYCESKFAHVSPEDIEHWRPKGAVTVAGGDERKPGYYWLAATWTNLLPSCIHCNRRQRQADARDPANEQSGKANRFPVADENHRWTRHDQANANGEEPLLLDPCQDDPSQFLTVDGEAVIHERRPADTRDNDRAKASIDVFGLNRRELVEERKKDRDEIVAVFHDVELYARLLPGLPAGPDRDDTRSALQAKLARLKQERATSSPYLLMKLSMIDEFTARVGPKLQALGIGV